MRGSNWTGHAAFDRDQRRMQSKRFDYAFLRLTCAIETSLDMIFTRFGSSFSWVLDGRLVEVLSRGKKTVHTSFAAQGTRMNGLVFFF